MFKSEFMDAELSVGIMGMGLSDQLEIIPYYRIRLSTCTSQFSAFIASCEGLHSSIVRRETTNRDAREFDDHKKSRSVLGDNVDGQDSNVGHQRRADVIARTGLSWICFASEIAEMPTVNCILLF